MSIYFLLNEIFFVSFEALNINLMFLIITNKRSFIRQEKLRILFFIILYTLFAYWIEYSTPYYIPIGYHTLLLSFLAVAILSFITRSNLRKTAIAFAVIIIFLTITEFPIAFIYSFLLKMNISEVVEIPKLKFFLSTAVKGSQLSIILILFSRKKTYFKNLSSDDENNIFAYFLFGVCLMFLLVFGLDYVISTGKVIMIYQVYIFSIIFLYGLLGFMIIKEKEYLIKLHHKYKLQEAYVSNIETILNIVRREKHDFANHLNTIHAMCLLNKPDAVDKIKKYIDKLAKNLHSSYHSYHTGNDYVDGILAVKSNFAYENDINLEVDFEDLLEDVSVDSYDLISILGNIIDNAFDAVLTNNEQRGKVVSICGYEENDNYCISIANNGPIIPLENLDTIFSNGYSTKKENRHDHGLGLYIVKQMVQKNNGLITVSSNEEETEFIIVLGRCKDGEISSKSYKSHST